MISNKKRLLDLTVEEFQELLRTWFPKKEEPKPLSPKLSELLVPQSSLLSLFHTTNVTIFKWERAGILPKKIKIGGRCFFLRAQIMKMINDTKANDDGKV